jgi:hypothetical protein
MTSIRLDGDNGIIVWSDEVGVKIFNVDPLAEINRLDTGSTISACNVNRTNIVSIVGGGERPKFRKGQNLVTTGFNINRHAGHEILKMIVF